MQNRLTPNFAFADMVPDHALGSRVWSTEGREYIDLAGGIAVNQDGKRRTVLEVLALPGLRLPGGVTGDAAIRADLGIVAYAAEHPVSDARRSPAAARSRDIFSCAKLLQKMISSPEAAIFHQMKFLSAMVKNMTLRICRKFLLKVISLQ